MTASWFSLDLLDTEAGQVLQTWELGDGDTVQLGRSRESDVVLASPFVSRTHACLHRNDEGWELSAVSRSGVFVDGARVEHLILTEGLTFRLAERGPLLRFRTAPAGTGSGSIETICFDSARTPILILDEQQRDREVVEIAEGDYFRQLQQKVARLRSQAAAQSSPQKPE